MYQYIYVIIYVDFRKDIKLGQVPCNVRELLNKYLRWSRAKVTAPAPAKYPGSGSETLRSRQGKLASLGTTVCRHFLILQFNIFFVNKN